MNEIEDGMGFSGLVPTKQERYIERLEKQNKVMREALEKLREMDDIGEYGCYYLATEALAEIKEEV